MNLASGAGWSGGPCVRWARCTAHAVCVCAAEQCCARGTTVWWALAARGSRLGALWARQAADGAVERQRDAARAGAQVVLVSSLNAHCAGVSVACPHRAPPPRERASDPLTTRPTRTNPVVSCWPRCPCRAHTARLMHRSRCPPPPQPRTAAPRACTLCAVPCTASCAHHTAAPRPCQARAANSGSDRSLVSRRAS